jgi:hypothetical protein
MPDIGGIAKFSGISLMGSSKKLSWFDEKNSLLFWLGELLNISSLILSLLKLLDVDLYY